MAFPKHFIHPDTETAPSSQRNETEAVNHGKRKAVSFIDPSSHSPISVTADPRNARKEIKRFREARQPVDTIDGSYAVRGHDNDTVFRVKPTDAGWPQRRTGSDSSSFDRAELASAFALASLSRAGSGSRDSASFHSESFGMMPTEAPRTHRRVISETKSADWMPNAQGHLINPPPKYAREVPMYVDQRFTVSPDTEGRDVEEARYVGVEQMRQVPPLDALMRVSPSANRVHPYPVHFRRPSMHYYAADSSPFHLETSPSLRMTPSSVMNMPPPAPSNSGARGKWGCDFCNAFSFSTYEEACAHEAQCQHRHKTRQGIPPLPTRPPRSILNKQSSGETCGATPSSGSRKPQRQVSFALSRDDQDSTNSATRAASLNNRDPAIRGAKRQHVTLCHDVTGPAKSNQIIYDEVTDSIFSKAVSIRPRPLAVPSMDSTWLSDLNAYIRTNCVEVFTASEVDVSRTSKRGRIFLNQVGIRCRFCVSYPGVDNSCCRNEAASVSFPVSISGIYESVKRWQRVHSIACSAIPNRTKEKLQELAESSVWVHTSRQYWSESAKALGMVDCPSGGIYFDKDPEDALKSYEAKKRCKNSESESSDESNNEISSTEKNTTAKSTAHIVLPEDMNEVSPYAFLLMSQVQATTFTEADSYVARSKGPIGYAGFECKHCSGHAGLGKYFPSSIKSLCTNSTSQNIHGHMLKCRRVPQSVKDELVELKKGGRSTHSLANGWRRKFFVRIWERIHGGAD